MTLEPFGTLGLLHAGLRRPAAYVHELLLDPLLVRIQGLKQ
jgi:hypothetical protein